MVIDIIKIFILKFLLALYTIIPTSTLSIGQIGEPQTFLPNEVKTDTERMISNLVFRKLFKYEDGQLVNDLVDKWEINDEKTEYKIKIVNNAYWQDGNKIDSDDVLYSISTNDSLKDDVEIEKLDDNTVLIRLPTQNAILPSLLTFGISPSHLKDQPKLHAIGSSSYRIARVIYEQDNIKSVVLQSFQDNKKYNRLKFNYYDSDNAQITGYKLGEIDVFISSQDFEWEGIHRDNISFLGRYFSLIFNTQNPKLENPELRNKLLTSMDIHSLLKSNYHINSIITQGPISYSEYTKDYFEESLYDPETEFTQQELSSLEDLEIILPNNQDGRQAETFIRKYWEDEVGLNLDFVYLDLEELIEVSRNGNFEVIFIGHEVTPDPDRYIFWHSTQYNALNLARFEDLRADKALEEGRKFYGFEDRQKHYNIFQDVIEVKVPAIFLYHPGTYLYSKSKKNFPVPKILYSPVDILNNL